MSTAINRQWILKKRPVGEIKDDDLQLQTSPLPELADGEVLIRTRWLSLDPSNRIWMSEAPSYMPPVPLDAPMRGLVQGEVMASRSAAWKAGDSVMSLATWSDYCVAPAAQVQRCEAVPGIAVEDVFGIFTLVGPTAWFGVVEIGAPRPGDCFVVSGAAGATGMLAGQIAKAMGCRVVGIAGGRDKCRMLVDELGFDASIDYKADDVGARLRELCPQGVDIYFDNVGGDILDAVLAQMNLYGRIVFSGMISGYNADGKTPGPTHYGNILMKRLRVQGYIVFDYEPRYAEAHKGLAALHAQGKLRWTLHRMQGLENAVQAVRMLYTGGNNGKLMLKVADDA